MHILKLFENSKKIKISFQKVQNLSLINTQIELERNLYRLKAQKIIEEEGPILNRPERIARMFMKVLVGNGEEGTTRVVCEYICVV